MSKYLKAVRTMARINEREVEASNDCPSCGLRYLLVELPPDAGGCAEMTACMRCGEAFPWHSFNVYCERHRACVTCSGTGYVELAILRALGDATPTIRCPDCAGQGASGEGQS